MVVVNKVLEYRNRFLGGNVRVAKPLCLVDYKSRRNGRAERVYYIDMPTRFFGDKKDGKYRLFWQCFPTGDIFYNLLSFTASAAYFESSPILDMGLEVIPFIPKDADLDLSKFKEKDITCLL